MFPVFCIVNNKEYYCSDRLSIYIYYTMQIFSSCPDRYGSCFSVYRNETSSCNHILDFEGKSKRKNGEVLFSGQDVQNSFHSSTEGEKLNFIYNGECVFQAKLIEFHLLVHQ